MKTSLTLAFLGLAVFAMTAYGLEAAPTATTTEGITERPETAEDASAHALRQELESTIKAKANELEHINRQLEETEGKLRDTQVQGAGLERELKTLQYNVNQLELNIQADEIAGQKLNLEIDSLGYDIRDIEISVEDKRKAITHILRELQKKDHSNLLVVFLKHDSLADGFLESQSLYNLRSQLGVDIANLEELHGQLSEKIGEVGDKKKKVEVHRQNLSSRKVIVQDQKEARGVILTQTKNRESLYEKQLDELEKQQDAISQEIGKIEDELRAKFDVSILPLKRPGVFEWPVAPNGGAKPRITQHFGERSKLYRGQPHNGLDIGASIGTPIVAADDGVVMAADNNDRSKWNKYQYGKYVLIRHENNFATLYAHLSSWAPDIRKGATVKRGQIIGYSGNTGYATGPHLHFGVYWAPSILMKSIPPAAGLVPVGVIINPEDYL